LNFTNQKQKGKRKGGGKSAFQQVLLGLREKKGEKKGRASRLTFAGKINEIGGKKGKEGKKKRGGGGKGVQTAANQGRETGHSSLTGTVTEGGEKREEPGPNSPRPG